MGKIFVRERTKFGRGTGRPRFAVIAVEGLDLKVYIQHIRKSELEGLAAEVGAEVIYLSRGAKANQHEVQEGTGKGRRKRKRDQE